MDILQKIKDAGLTGRGGGGFPTAQKWEMVKNAVGEKKYVVCNAAEGEPDVAKDGFILENHPEKVIKGIKLAIEFLGAEKAMVFLNYKYFNKFKEKIAKTIGNAPIIIFEKPEYSGYVAGEETTQLNIIEGKRIEPRLRPPFPPISGLWGFPTLINNVETFYNVALVEEGAFENKRFYTIAGDCKNPGVFTFEDSVNIDDVLRRTSNFPEHEFFVQIGGGASGEVLNKQQLNKPATGAGSITVYRSDKYSPKEMVKKWINFFEHESCGQCTPCREGTLRLKEIIESDKPDWQLFNDLVDNLSESAFCGLGTALPIPLKTYVQNVLSGNNLS